MVNGLKKDLKVVKKGTGKKVCLKAAAAGNW